MRFGGGVRGRRFAGAGRTGALLLFIAFGIAVLSGTVGAGGGVGAQEATPASTTTSPTAPTATPAENGSAVRATVRAGDEAIAGVKITVSRNGSVVGEGVSDDKGVVVIAVPEAGQYEAKLDTGSLPGGVKLVDPTRATLKPQVRTGAPAPVVFALQRGEAVDTTPAFGTRFLNLLVSGLRFGLVIATASVGLSLIFGTTRLTNFAHSEMVVVGAVAAWYANDPKTLGLPLILAAVVGVIAGGCFGGALELGVFKPLRRRGMDHLSMMVVSIGLAFALRYLINVIFGANPLPFADYAAQSATVHLGPIHMRPKDLVVMAVCLVALVGVGLFLQKSRFGTAIRAVSDNRDLASASGINVSRVITIVWVLSGALAGLGGVLLGLTEMVSWHMGQRMLLVMFAAVVLGGLGTAFGAMAGGIVVGVISDLSTLWLDADLKIVVALGSLIIVLLFRPQGIFGVRERTG
jgi:branched-chain amino acid transport system permease protein